jgi:antitoxin (DNA-binding transcriptional repressor) of toxin-antitoxin stability system
LPELSSVVRLFSLCAAVVGSLQLTEKEMCMKTIELTPEVGLQSLMDEVKHGEEVVLTENHIPVAKIVAVPQEPRRTPRAGSLKGEIWMAPDFDAPLEEFKEYME